MRGLLCAEFLDFAGSRYGAAPGPEEPVCDPTGCPGPGHLLTWADLVAARSGISAERLLGLFGAILFGRLVRGYPSFLVGIESTIDLITRYETLVVAEVRKLDASAQPPELGLVRAESRTLEVTYRSSRGLADLAEGLLRGSIAHFGEELDVERCGSWHDPTCVAFRLVERAAPAQGGPSIGERRIDDSPMIEEVALRRLRDRIRHTRSASKAPASRPNDRATGPTSRAKG
jgi:hypothetical protein